MDFMTTFAAAGHVLKTLRDLVSADKALNAAEFKLKIADLSVAMSDLKQAHIETKDDLAQAKGEIDRLKKLLRRKADFVEYRGLHYDKTTDGKPQGSAYCSVCEQKLGMLFHLTRLQAKDICPNCKTVYSAHLFGYEGQS
jgi:hypothetical protein